MKINKSYFLNINKDNLEEIDYLRILLSNLNYDININEYKKFLANNCDAIVEQLKFSHSKVLVKGDVQSGKTINLIYIVAKLIKEYNFKLFFVQTGRCNALNDQNFKRFKDTFQDSGIAVKCYKFKSFNVEQIKQDYKEGAEAIVIFGLKHLSDIQQKINRFPSEENWKFLVIDDESDDASLKQNYESKIETLISENGSYLQITATPYKSLKRYNGLNFYTFYKSLQSPKNYKGLYNFIKILPNIVEENTLSKKLFYKVILASFKNKQKNHLKYGKIIFNLNRETVDHKKTASHIKDFLRERDIVQYIESNIPEGYEKILFDKENIINFKQFINELKINVHIFNSEIDYFITRTNQIIIGGDIISRGLTFDNLLAQIIIMNNITFGATNIMQKARWFGYHKCDVDVFMNKNLFNAYKECSVLEEITDSFKINDKNEDYINKFKLKNFKLITINIENKEE